MTYDVQRYLVSRKDLQRADGSMMMSGSDIFVVIAADAEAHEKAARDSWRWFLMATSPEGHEEFIRLFAGAELPQWTDPSDLSRLSVEAFSASVGWVDRASHGSIRLHGEGVSEHSVDLDAVGGVSGEPTNDWYEAGLNRATLTLSTKLSELKTHE